VSVTSLVSIIEKGIKLVFRHLAARKDWCETYCPETGFIM
jgi:hypothetical protein